MNGGVCRPLDGSCNCTGTGFIGTTCQTGMIILLILLVFVFINIKINEIMNRWFMWS